MVILGEENPEPCPEELALPVLGNARRKPGRPCDLDDAALANRRDSLLGVFEYHWAEFGWELQRAKTIVAVRKALYPIRESSEVELLVHEPTEMVTFAELRHLRRTQEKLGTQLQSAHEDERRMRDRLENALNALRQRASDKQLQRLCDSREQSFFSAEKHRKGLEQRFERNRDALKRKGAYLCQSELLDFITSRRYSLTPLHLANALAGLPLISWRHSATRCNKLEASHPFEIVYEMFRHVARGLMNPTRTTDHAVEQLRAYLRKRKPRSDNALQRLKDEFYYLRLAVDSAYAAKPLRTAIPYRVFANYQRRSSCRSAYDETMQEEERL